MNQQALEAAADAVAAELKRLVEEGVNFHDGALTLAGAALTAYAEACGERVVYENTGSTPEIFETQDSGCWLQPGEELVVRKAGM